MKKIILTSLVLYCSLNAMEEQTPAIDVKNRAQVISLIEAIMRKTFSFEGTQASDLVSFPDYQDPSTLYRVSLYTIDKTVSQIVALPSTNTIEQRHTAIFNRHPRKCEAQRAKLLDLYESITENDIYWLAVDNFKAYYEQCDLEPRSQKDKTRNLTEIKENRLNLFKALHTNDAALFKSMQRSELTKKPFLPLLVYVNKGILLIKKKGQDIIDSPENSDDDNMPEIPESKKNDVSQIITRLQQLNHGD